MVAEVEIIKEKVHKVIALRIKQVQNLQTKLDFYYTNGVFDADSEHLRLQKYISKERFSQYMHNQIKKLNRKIEHAKKIDYTKIIAKTKNPCTQKELDLSYAFKIQKGYLHQKDMLYIGRSSEGNDKVHQKTNTKDYTHFHANIRGGSLVAISKKITEKDSLYPWVLVYSKYYKSKGVVEGDITQTTKAHATKISGSFIFTDKTTIKSNMTNSRLYLYMYGCGNQRGSLSFLKDKSLENTPDYNSKYVLSFKITESSSDKWVILVDFFKKKNIFISKKTIQDLNNLLPSYMCLDSINSI